MKIIENNCQNIESDFSKPLVDTAAQLVYRRLRRAEARLITVH